MPKVNIFVGDVDNDVDAAGGSDVRAENPETIFVLASALSDSRTFGFESTSPAAVLELIEFLSFESEAPPNLKIVDSPPTDEEKVNGACGTLSIFLLIPKLIDGASVSVSFDGADLSKPNIGPVLVDSLDGASAPVSSVEGTKLFPKLNMGGLATDPFGEVDFSEPKVVCVNALTAPAFGLIVESAAIDEVIDVGVSTFSSTIETSAVLRLLPAIKLLDDITTDESGGIS